MKLKDIIKVEAEKYDIVNSKSSCDEAFANIKYKNLFTVIIKQGIISEENIVEIEKDWKLINFNIVFSFGLVGFIAKISQALADAGISIFVVSSYSTDHLLVKEKDLDKTLNVLEELEVDL